MAPVQNHEGLDPAARPEGRHRKRMPLRLPSPSSPTLATKASAAEAHRPGSARNRPSHRRRAASPGAVVRHPWPVKTGRPARSESRRGGAAPEPCLGGRSGQSGGRRGPPAEGRRHFRRGPAVLHTKLAELLGHPFGSFLARRRWGAGTRHSSRYARYSLPSRLNHSKHSRTPAHSAASVTAWGAPGMAAHFPGRSETRGILKTVYRVPGRLAVVCRYTE